MVNLDELSEACISIGRGDTRISQQSKTTAMVISAVQAFDLDNTLVIITVPNQQLVDHVLDSIKAIRPEINHLGYELIGFTNSSIRFKRIKGLWVKDGCGDSIYDDDYDQFIIRCQVPSVIKLHHIDQGFPHVDGEYISGCY